MKNELFSKKIEGIYTNLMQCYKETQKYSPTIVGEEREIFNRELLQKILPPMYRMGSGSIVDSKGRVTGQVDAIIELPFSLSFPISTGKNRLYLADSIGAAFEIKSDLNNQWDEAISKIEEIKQLHRYEIKSNEFAMGDKLKIPTFIIAFRGQKSIDTVLNKFQSIAPINQPDGVLILESGIFYGRNVGRGSVYESKSPNKSILAFISCIYQILKTYSQNEVQIDKYQNILV